MLSGEKLFFFGDGISCGRFCWFVLTVFLFSYDLSASRFAFLGNP
jgi:hypothetical protein